MGMDAMEEALAKKKIERARIEGQRTKTSQSKESERLRYQRGETQVILFNIAEGISLHEGETNNGGNNVPRCQIDHDLRWSAIQAHQNRRPQPPRREVCSFRRRWPIFLHRRSLDPLQSSIRWLYLGRTEWRYRLERRELGNTPGQREG
jgi:hypothetical protein